MCALSAIPAPLARLCCAYRPRDSNPDYPRPERGASTFGLERPVELERRDALTARHDLLPCFNRAHFPAAGHGAGCMSSMPNPESGSSPRVPYAGSHGIFHKGVFHCGVFKSRHTRSPAGEGFAWAAGVEPAFDRFWRSIAYPLAHPHVVMNRKAAWVVSRRLLVVPLEELPGSLPRSELATCQHGAPVAAPMPDQFCSVIHGWSFRRSREAAPRPSGIKIVNR